MPVELVSSAVSPVSTPRVHGAKYARVPPAEAKDEIAATLALWREVFGND